MKVKVRSKLGGMRWRRRLEELRGEATRWMVERMGCCWR